jgi:hypothetical protein
MAEWRSGAEKKEYSGNSKLLRGAVEEVQEDDWGAGKLLLSDLVCAAHALATKRDQM